jgi:hydrogenase maturation protease
VIGVGNVYRRDDAIGPELVRRLRRRRLPGVTLVECDGEPTRLLDLWAGTDLAVVVDAVRCAPSQPGRVHRRSLRHPAMRTLGSASSHGVELGDAVALAVALDRLPGTLLLYAVEASDTTVGLGLTPGLDGALDDLADEIADEIAARAIRSTGR